MGANWRIKEWFPHLSEETIEKLLAHYKEVIRFSKNLNLIGKGTLESADFFHFADSILGCQIIDNDCSPHHLADIGSGNGFPGIIYACLFPATQVTLIEKDERKCEFLKFSAKKVGLTNVSVNNVNLLELDGSNITCAMARGFASLSASSLKSFNSLSSEGVFYHFKGRDWSNEVSQIPPQLCEVWKIQHLADYTLPDVEDNSEKLPIADEETIIRSIIKMTKR